MLLPIAAIIFLTVVPQRRQKAKQAQLMKSLSVGDEVVTIGGIHGVVNHIEDDAVHLEVDDDVVLKIGLGAVNRKAEDADPALSSRSRGGFLGALTGGSAGGSSRGGDPADNGDDTGSGENGPEDSPADSDGERDS